MVAGSRVEMTVVFGILAGTPGPGDPDPPDPSPEATQLALTCGSSWGLRDANPYPIPLPRPTFVSGDRNGSHCLLVCAGASGVGRSHIKSALLSQSPDKFAYPAPCE